MLTGAAPGMTQYQWPAANRCHHSATKWLLQARPGFPGRPITFSVNPPNGAPLIAATVHQRPLLDPKRARLREPVVASKTLDQFRLRSTSARCLIQGIISRSLAPTCSIGCSASLARVALNEVWLTLFSSIQSRVKRPDWMSDSTRFISARVSALMMRGPVTYSPYSAVFEIE